MTTPGSTPEQGLPTGAPLPEAAGAPELSADALRAKVAALADQVRALANGSHPTLGNPPAMAATERGAVARSDQAGGSAGVRPPRSADGVAREEPAAAPGDAAAAAVEEFADLSGMLLATVIDTAELAAAEIRASAEREAADIRERAEAAIGEADAALARYREALAALAVETERIERSIAALREQAQTLEQERGHVDVALELLRRRPAR